MSEKFLGIRNAKERKMIPAIDLFPQVKYKGRKIDAAVFGPGTYGNNVIAMKKRYFHSNNLPNVTFKPLNTAESIAVAGHDFKNLAKPMIFDNNCLQAGRVLRTQIGVWANLPRDDKGKLITDENALKEYLHQAQKIKVNKGHIYFGNNDFGFAEYETFERGIQDCGTFAQGGLALVLEHNPKEAINLRAIASPRNYKLGVDVFAFEPVKEPLLRFVSLLSGRDVDGDGLYVDGYDWYDYDDGFAFGGLVSGEASARKI